MDELSPCDAALQYAQRGWSVVPVPHRGKNPGFRKWEQLRLKVEDIDQCFPGGPQNIGVLLGAPSDWVVDVDLDHLRAVELADDFLPPTPAVFGREGKPRSHRIYHVTAPVATKKYPSKTEGMIVELRSTGSQTVFPPSAHESGEAIRWEDAEAVPADVDPSVLFESVKALANAVKVEQGEKRAKPPKRRRGDPPWKSTSSTRAADNSSPEAPPQTPDRAAACLEAMLRIGIVDQRDGSRRLFTAACRAIEYDLDDATSLSTIRDYERQRSFPRSWTDDEILQRVRDAEKICERGEALKRDENGCVPLGSRDPASGRLVLAPRRTLPTARAYVLDFHQHPAGRTLHFYGGVLMEWRGNRYQEVEDAAVKKRLQHWLHEALRYILNRQTGAPELVPFESNPGTVKSALESIQAFTHLAATVTCPSWLGRQPNLLPVDILPCRSSLLHLPTMTHLPPTPLFFTTSALEFDPNFNAPPPQRWLEFLHQLFDDDEESWDLLQEWFGYCLTGNTSQQKMLLMVGPKRSGKGTIARVLTKLIGSANVSGPTTSSLAGSFGLQPLIGKALAIVSDARFHGDNIPIVVERLLCISGEDALTIDRKHMTSVTMKLPTRFMFLTNEFPRLTDSSGALAGRFVMLRLNHTFYGKEDIGLTECLLEELPSILNWAIEGWMRLHARGHFVMPSSVADVVREIEDLSSPVNAFVRDACTVGPGHRVDLDILYDAWCQWCRIDGRNAISTKQVFGRDLASAVAGIIRRRSPVPFYDGISLNANWR
ncbi:MAG: phage/plasmid primase, P4 family [Planctomycetaceae bacterium]